MIHGYELSTTKGVSTAPDVFDLNPEFIDEHNHMIVPPWQLDEKPEDIKNIVERHMMGLRRGLEGIGCPPDDDLFYDIAEEIERKILKRFDK
jgi:hypothetical protein